MKPKPSKIELINDGGNEKKVVYRITIFIVLLCVTLCNILAVIGGMKMLQRLVLHRTNESSSVAELHERAFNYRIFFN